MPHTYTDAQVRKALAKLSRITAFCDKYQHLRVSERTIYRQRADDPPPLRPYVRGKLAEALILEGLLEQPRPAIAPAKTKRRKKAHPSAALA